MSEFDCLYVPEIICPYCGCEYQDSHEYFSNSDEDAEIKCDECEKEFLVSRDIDVTYSSTKKELK